MIELEAVNELNIFVCNTVNISQGVIVEAVEVTVNIITRGDTHLCVNHLQFIRFLRFSGK